MWCRNLFDLISTRAGFCFFNWGTMKFVGRLWSVGRVDLVRKSWLVLILVELVFFCSAETGFNFRESCSVISRKVTFKHEITGCPLIWDQIGLTRFEIFFCLIRQLMYKSTGILYEYVKSNWCVNQLGFLLWLRSHEIIVRQLKYESTEIFCFCVSM